MYNGVKVCHIVATDLNGCIGKDGQMPWHLPADLKRFKELTTGGVVIMGRKTFESLGCKPLPNRFNIILTRADDINIGYPPYDALAVNNIQSALLFAANYAKSKDLPCIWIIGGAEIYAQTMQYVDVIEHTVVITEIADGDAYYPSNPSPFKVCMPSQNFQDEVSGLRFYYRKLVRAQS